MSVRADAFLPGRIEVDGGSNLSDQPVAQQPHPSSAGLEPYTAGLTRRQLAHLLRRTGFGANPAKINLLFGQAAPQIVDQIVTHAASGLPNPEKPPWASIPVPDRQVDPPEVIKEFNMNNQRWLLEFRVDWMSWFQKGDFREKMTLFWHNHFVTGASTYSTAAMAYEYIKLLRKHALGNFKDFVYDVGLTPAMLLYLNGNENTKDAPNENYARELLELFTMSPRDNTGQRNYTQNDVQEIARALTGWKVNYSNFTAEFDDQEFDDGIKRFLDKSGAYGYDQVIDVIFNQRPQQIAYHVCSKIYREFVYDIPDESIVQELASIFLANNFEIRPVVSTLLKSAHFFEDRFIGAKVKSPVELVIGLLKEANYVPSTGTYELGYGSAVEMQQDILDPPDVSGWPGHRSWLSTNTLPIRWSVTESLLYTARDNQPLDLVEVARLFPDANDVHAAFKLPVAMAEHYLAVPISELNIGEIDENFDGDLVTNPIPQAILNGPDYARTLAKIFLGGIPWYEWSLEENGANNALLSYMQYLMLFPEFHLT